MSKNENKNVLEYPNPNLLEELLLLAEQNMGAGDGMQYARQAFELSFQESDPLRTGEVLKRLGALFIRFQCFSEAVDCYRGLLTIGCEDKAERANILGRMGVAYWNLCNYNRALECQNEAIRLREELEDIHGMAAALNNIGLIYEKMFDWASAIKAHERSLELKTQVGFQEGMARSLNNLGNIHLRLDNTEHALTLYQRSLTIKRNLGDEAGIAHSLNNIGKIHEVRGEYKAAIDCYRESAEIKERLGDVLGQINTLHNLGRVFLYQEQYDQALSILGQALQQAEEQDSAEHLRMIHEVYSEVYAAIGDYQRAYKSHIAYSQYRDAVYSEENRRQFAELNARIQLAEKEREAKAIRLRNTELSDALSKLEDANKKLAAAQTEKLELERKNTAFAMAITANHEINQPLMVISGCLDLLAMQDLDLNEKNAGLILRMQKALERITEILNKYRKATHIRFTNYSDKTMMILFDDPEQAPTPEQE
jgi:tetratricopeptide (TPR) repeat protein